MNFHEYALLSVEGRLFQGEHASEYTNDLIARLAEATQQLIFTASVPCPSCAARGVVPVSEGTN